MTNPKPSAKQFRGDLVDIGGRRLRVVRCGTTHPGLLIVFECGAFGCAADWAVIQARLEAQGLASLAYDRAGLGFSDPGPGPRDGQAIVQDLERLLEALGEVRQIVLVGHSMAGQLLPIYVGRNHGRSSGLVLVDAVVPEAAEIPLAARYIGRYRTAMNFVGRWSGLGFMKPISMVAGNLIGLEGEAAREKRHIYGMASHARGSAAEVDQWFATAAQAREAGAFPTSLPVAVVTAGQTWFPRRFKALQASPSESSMYGRALDVKGAHHASLLGVQFADSVVDAVWHVVNHS